MLANAKIAFFGTCTLAAACIATALIAPRNVEAELKQQCLTQDWPVHQHKAHAEYCMSLGLQVGE